MLVRQAMIGRPGRDFQRPVISNVKGSESHRYNNSRLSEIARTEHPAARGQATTPGSLAGSIVSCACPADHAPAWDRHILAAHPLVPRQYTPE